MDSSRPNLEEKAAYFELLGSLQGCAADDGDQVDIREQRDREQRLRFFRPAPASATAAAAKTRHVTPSREPMRGQQVIPGTRSGAVGQKWRLLAPKAEDMEETAIPDSTIRAPEPPFKKRLLAEESEQSPSLGVGAKRGRKRSSGPRMRPDEEQVFKNLAFFYVPNNDIAPARRLRIGKAREFGALWTRDVSTATHVIVDKHLDYQDVEKAIAAASLSHIPILVTEDYPVDCIQFRSLLDHSQKKYKIAGQPEEDAKQETAACPEKQGESSPKHNIPGPWGHVPQTSTALGREEPSQRGAVSTAPDAGAENKELQGSKEARDELSGCISIMQEFKDLPLHNEDEDGRLDSEEEDKDENDGEEEEEEDTRSPNKGNMPLRAGRKNITFEDHFACNQAGEREAKTKNPNARTIEVLQSMANYYDRINDSWRTMGYRKAITTLKRQDSKVCTEEEAFRLPHIGRRIAQKIEEIVTTNKLQRLEYAQEEPTAKMLQLFLNIHGVGSTQAQQWIAQGHRSLEDVAQKATLTRSQRIGIEHYDDLNTRIPRREVEALGTVVRRAAAGVDAEIELIIGGSYRRGADSSHDIDLMVTKRGTESAGELRPFLDELVRRLEADKFLAARLASSRSAGEGSMWQGCCVLPRTPGLNDVDYRPVWRRIDFLLVPEAEMGAALIYFTGNDMFNRSMRLLASKKGMRLNQHGLYGDVVRGPARKRINTGRLVEGRDERRIFEMLGVQWREPHERWC